MLKNLMGLFSKSTNAAATAASKATGGGGYSASSPPKYIYKLVPHSTTNQRYAFPNPIPASWEFAVSELDAKDGFLHFSTEDQIQGTLERFFSEDNVVTILKADYGRLSGFKIVKWEKASNGQEYPHLYAQLEGEYVEDFSDFWRTEGGAIEQSSNLKSWAEVVEKARQEGWLQ